MATVFPIHGEPFSLPLDLELPPDTYLIDCTDLRRCVPFPSWSTFLPNTTTVTAPARAIFEARA